MTDASALPESSSSAADGPLTLAIDIGGTNLKCGVLDKNGKFLTERQRVPTPKPSSPQAVVDALTKLVEPLGSFDRIAIGFPGVVRGDTVFTAPNLGTQAWHGFPLARILAEKWNKPTRMLNDGSIQGLGVIAGQGLECVITLGTGMGFALFSDGYLAPHLEMGQHPAYKKKTYDKYIGGMALQDIGLERWNRRIKRVIDQLVTLTGYDMLYIGGGNARNILFVLPANVQTVSNRAGITGGAKLWDPRLAHAFANKPIAAFPQSQASLPADGDP